MFLPLEAATRTLETAPDRGRSPFTGYTRQHWLEITERILAGYLAQLDPATGLPNLNGVPGDRGHALLHNGDPVLRKVRSAEAVAMLAAYYTAATGRDQVPGHRGSITAPLRAIITRAADPADPLKLRGGGPRFMIGPEVAFAILVNPRLFWEPFTREQQQRILDALEVLERTTTSDNNHHLFHMIPVPVLEQHGRPTRRAHHTTMLERIATWHRGEGWFIDGPANNSAFDGYTFWGFHLYLNALAHFDDAWRIRFRETLAPVTARFLEGAPHFFGCDGGPIPWGRSLVVRWGLLGSFGWAQLNGANPLAPGLTRRICSGVLKYFWEHGALHENGVLETGYRGANAVAAENYVGDGTGYFSAIGLSALLIPETDPFWNDVEQPMPADETGGRLVLPGAGMVVRVRASDGESRLFPVSQPARMNSRWQTGTKYHQHAYSRFLGWAALGAGSEELGQGRTGYSTDGKTWRYRENAVGDLLTADQVASRFPLKLAGERAGDATSASSSPQITTHTLIGDSGEVHVFWHDAAQPLWLHLGGYGIHADDRPSLQSETTGTRVHLRAEGRHSVLHAVRAPDGRLDVRVLEPRDGWRHSHLFGGHGAFPFWRSDAPVERHAPVVFFVEGRRDRELEIPSIEVVRGHDTLVVTFEGKTHEISIR